MGLLVEHWDVMQEEVPAEETVSRNPLFTRLGVRHFNTQ
jgi:predicted SnoaL-like aldol condensation-catalyzing enzyme